MKKIGKAIAIVLTLAICLAFLAACDIGGGSDKDSEGPGEQSGKPGLTTEKTENGIRMTYAMENGKNYVFEIIGNEDGYGQKMTAAVPDWGDTPVVLYSDAVDAYVAEVGDWVYGVCLDKGYSVILLREREGFEEEMIVLHADGTFGSPDETDELLPDEGKPGEGKPDEGKPGKRGLTTEQTENGIRKTYNNNPVPYIIEIPSDGATITVRATEWRDASPLTLYRVGESGDSYAAEFNGYVLRVVFGPGDMVTLSHCRKDGSGLRRMIVHADGTSEYPDDENPDDKNPDHVHDPFRDEYFDPPAGSCITKKGIDGGMKITYAANNGKNYVFEIVENEDGTKMTATVPEWGDTPVVLNEPGYMCFAGSVGGCVYAVRLGKGCSGILTREREGSTETIVLHADGTFGSPEEAAELLPDEGRPVEGNPDEGNPVEGNPDEGNPGEGPAFDPPADSCITKENIANGMKITYTAKNGKNYVFEVTREEGAMTMSATVPEWGENPVVLEQVKEEEKHFTGNVGGYDYGVMVDPDYSAILEWARIESSGGIVIFADGTCITYEGTANESKTTIYTERGKYVFEIIENEDGAKMTATVPEWGENAVELDQIDKEIFEKDIDGCLYRVEGGEYGSIILTWGPEGSTETIVLHAAGTVGMPGEGGGIAPEDPFAGTCITAEETANGTKLRYAANNGKEYVFEIIGNEDGAKMTATVPEWGENAVELMMDETGEAFEKATDDCLYRVQPDPEKSMTLILTRESELITERIVVNADGTVSVS